jgi:hypothetical protein
LAITGTNDDSPPVAESSNSRLQGTREASMGFSNHSQTYDPLDLEILDRVYEAAWARIEATEPRRDFAQDEHRQKALRHLVFTLAGGHPVDFDALLEKIDAIPGSWLKTLSAEVAA